MIFKTDILRSLPEDPMCLASRAQQGEQWQYQTRESLGQHPPSIGSGQIYMCCFHSQIFSPNYLSKTSEGTPWWVLLCTSSSLFHLDTCSLFSVHIPTQSFQLYETLKGKLADKGLRELPSGSRIVKISFHDKKAIVFLQTFESGRQTVYVLVAKLLCVCEAPTLHLYN